MSITSNELIPLLLAACPTALPAWEEHIADWGAEERGLYNDISILAHHVVNAYAAGSTAEFPAFFAAVERLVTEGDAKVMEIATIGLLEDIQCVASHKPFGYRVFEPWLGPATRIKWSEVEVAWQGHGSLMDVIRAEAQKKQ